MIVVISTTADGSMYNRRDKQDPAIIANREAFLAKNNITMEQSTMLLSNILQREQNHEANFRRYQQVTSDDYGKSMRDEQAFPIDAIVTTEANHALFLPIADCVATTIYDPMNHVLMLTHLGRHSLEQQGGTASVQFLTKQYGSNPADLLVWASPAPNKDVFPIWKLNNQGMKEAWFAQMAAAGILPGHITDNPADSATNPDYYSYSEFLKGSAENDGDYCMVAMMTD